MSKKLNQDQLKEIQDLKMLFIDNELLEASDI